MRTLARYRDLGATSTMGHHVSVGISERIRQISISWPRHLSMSGPRRTTHPTHTARPSARSSRKVDPPKRLMRVRRYPP
ncbi:hypothetical protein D2E29_16005 [Mycobacteroides abscessus]|nr:hypothetical protein DDJ46_14165 [Mycobacteroides abscessus]PVA51241.1 hypothetical protein DDJ73_13910 [Mycobacteroides abscessus]RIQ87653.1 hypothetical protein D2E32_05170 [Mycobacteroides abscessus]RIR08946.1 hypothetical protein D2E29_16005 [Mycobacteroides abscessus]RIS29137.1 hypothetical protein D2E56_04475 [Mycobacteroides abscessus]